MPHSWLAYTKQEKIRAFQWGAIHLPTSRGYAKCVNLQGVTLWKFLDYWRPITLQHFEIEKLYHLFRNLKSISIWCVTLLKCTWNRRVSIPGLFPTCKKYRFGQTWYFPSFITAVSNPGFKPKKISGYKPVKIPGSNSALNLSNLNLNLEKFQLLNLEKCQVRNLKKYQV